MISYLTEKIGQTVALHGAVHKIRRMKGFSFLLLRCARDVIQCIHTNADAGFDISTLKEESCVRLQGYIRQEPRAKHGFDVVIKGLEVLQAPSEALPIVINQPQVDASLDTLLNYRPITLRNPAQRAVFRLQAGLCRGIRGYLEGENFVEIHTPKLVFAGAEGGANEFSLPYFGQTAHLAQSPQQHKQMLAAVYERVYEIAPVFRAEKHDTARHLNEYTSIDLEMAYISGVEEIMALEERMLAHCLGFLQQEYGPELALLGARLPTVGSIPRIRFDEGKEWVSRHFQRPIGEGHDLQPEEERLLCQLVSEQGGGDFVFVTHYPSKTRPFYAMDDPEDPRYTLSFDLLFRGMEVTTGGQRISDYSAQLQKMQARGMNPDAFQSYLMLHKYGAPPHGGLGLGLERLLGQLLGFANIRQSSLFPRDTSRLVP